MKFGNKLHYGIGTLIGQNYVITSAENLFYNEEGKMYKEPDIINFYPGLLR